MKYSKELLVAQPAEPAHVPDVMPSTLELDRKDPGIDDMVGAWADGQEYELRIKVRQVMSDAKTTKLEVIEATDETPEEETEEEAPPPVKAPPKKMPPGKPKPEMEINY